MLPGRFAFLRVFACLQLNLGSVSLGFSSECTAPHNLHTSTDLLVYKDATDLPECQALLFSFTPTFTLRRTELSLHTRLVVPFFNIMLFYHSLFALLSALIVVAHPLSFKRAPEDPVLFDPDTDFETQARKANNDPNRVIPTACTKVEDCSCPVNPNPSNGITQSTSCINGFCDCNNPIVGVFANEFLDAVTAIGNAPITKAMSQLFQGIADVKEVAGTIIAQFLPPPAKIALKAALNVIPDTGPSHIDQAAKDLLNQAVDNAPEA
ncbi:hypothetical protein DL96DRAFT_1600829 [Flagelloscypha sp. PMI_526]|nr:hypothetical protein DL96DRAFT_1600829 [Flagelloscypha sp. PMI_526]